MTNVTKKEKRMADSRLNPDGVFYLAAPVMNTDGTVQPADADGNQTYRKLDECLTAIVEQVEDNGDDYWIYECRPIKRVVRGKVRVIEVKRK